MLETKNIPNLSIKHEHLGFGSNGGIDECMSARLNYKQMKDSSSKKQLPLTARSPLGKGPANAAYSNRVPSTSSTMTTSGPLTPAQVLFFFLLIYFN